MILYHGTNTDFQHIDISKSFPCKDFGKGFCLTEIQGHAIRMAKHKTCAFGGTAIVQEYQFDEACLRDDSLKVQFFDRVSVEWAEFILKNRDWKQDFHHDYDIVIGPTVDDRVAFLINRYESGAIIMRELIRMLKNRKLSNQYCFETPKAVSFLKRIR